MNNTIIFALMLSLLAGLSTGIGGLLCFVIKKDNYKALSLGLGFSAGIMLYMSFVEVLSESEKLIATSSEYAGWYTILGFFLGIFVSIMIDFLLPEDANCSSLSKCRDCKKSCEDCDIKKYKDKKLKRVGVSIAIAVAVHNFPEGLATFISAMSNFELGIAIAIAVAIHNIPEGIAVALPIYNSTGSKKKAFLYALGSGFFEPLGAVLGYLILAPYMNDFIFGILLSSISGIMMYIVFDEILPTSTEYGNKHVSLMGIIAGMLVMAISLELF